MNTPSIMDLTAHFTDHSEDDLLTPKQLAAILGVTTRTVERHRLTGQGVPFIRFSSKVIRYRRADLREFLRERTSYRAAA